MEFLISILSSPLLLLASILGLVTLYITTLIIYRLTFHPLAKYPGPKLAAITDIYLTYYAYRGNRHLAFHLAHEKYGSHVRIGPNTLSINTAPALKSIYGFRANVRKADFYTAFPANKHTYNVHSSIDKAQHARKRRVMSHAFSDAAIKSLERWILANVRTGCRLLAEKGVAAEGGEKGWREAWNAADWCNCKAQAMERTKMGLDVDRKDFFYHLLNAKDPETGNGFSMDELWGESNLLIIAGSDTTSTSMAATFFYLAHNTSTLQKLCHEIRTTFSDVEEIVSGPKLSGCAYLRACIDESMRMTPPVAGALPRQVLPGGIDIDGHHIPAGVDVGVPHYAIHHNADYFPRPFDFVPERWLSDPTANPLHDKLTEAHAAFCPFSIGPRGCIGKGLAYVELTVTIARVLYLFDLRLAPGSTLGAGSKDLEVGRTRATEYQIEDRFASMKDGPMLQFRPKTA
ncbi:hypothetical protein GRF29_8g3398054 [Pseudopithomyces chartarum]|uniref:Cytochrome P450 n=1 Tax=Pseudopithomyces chartarum TaxID=1892770 RepID=A0AAN6M7N0_9PLEO|nr:hypothetical protein GRF29_8g3398054 [Pseudopithomyces chartarum]